MKPITTFLVVLALSTSGFITAQDLSSFYTLAHYSMILTAADQQGHYEDIELLNSPYADTNGVYCNGLYINGFNPDGSLVHTPSIRALYDTAFAVRMEFKIDSLPTTIAPVFICGDNWRYLGMMVRWDGLMMYNFNGASYTVMGTDVSANKWHTATAVYDNRNSMAQFWLDGQLIATHTGTLERPDNDDRVSNTDFGNGFTFLGNLRNLKVYSSEEFLSSTKSQLMEAPGLLFPNPAHNQLSIANAQFTQWTIYSFNGSIRSKGKSSAVEPINVSNLVPGSYLLVLLNDQNEIVSRQQFQKI